MDKITCPECGSGNATSHGGSVTLAYYPPRVIDGVEHHHDGNRRTNAYTCDNGHDFVAYSTKPCTVDGCKFGHEPPRIVKRGP